jgi:hypothetical protein
MLHPMASRKDFSQVALDVVRRATGEAPAPEPAPKPTKKTAPKGTKGAAKKSAKKPDPA